MSGFDAVDGSASDLSEALDDTLHDHTDKLDKLREVDLRPKCCS
jgi:hypothetical protein